MTNELNRAAVVSRRPFNTRQRPIPPPPSQEGAARKVRWSRSLVVAGVLLMSYGLPLALVGIDLWISQRLIQLMILVLYPLHIVRMRHKGALNRHYVLVSLFFAYMFIVSALYNIVITSNPLLSWAPGMLVLLPLLLFSVYDFIGATIEEVALGFIITAVFCAMLTIVDQAVNLTTMDAYVRSSRYGQGVRRLVLAKTEQAFAVILLVAMVPRARSALTRAILIICIVAVAYALVAVSESRLVLAATLIGGSVYLIVVLKAPSRIGLFFFLAGLALIAAPFVLPTYLGSSDFLSGDASVRFRILENDFFGRYFDATNGLGFGAMYLNERLDNILSFAMFRAGELLGAPGYAVSLGDLGLLGALYQFGYVGAALTLLLTATMVYRLLKAGRDRTSVYSDTLGVFGAVALGFVVSPLPMNFFTLEWTVTFGGTLWYLVGQADAWRDAADSRRLHAGTPRNVRSSRLA